MKLNRGCGCLLLGLAAVNLMALAGAIVTLVSGDDLWIAVLGLALFGSNLVASLILGIGAFRGVAIMRTRDVADEMEGEPGQRQVEENEGEERVED